MTSRRLAMAWMLVVAAPGLLHAEAAAVRVDSATAPQPTLHAGLLALDAQGHGPLDAASLAKFKALIAQYGWPTVPTAGMDGVDAAGDLALRSSADYDYQNALEAAMAQRIGIDIAAQAFATLNDRVEVQHGHPQQLGSLLALDHGKVVTLPQETATAANPMRDSFGLPLLDPWLQQVQRKVDGGASLQTAMATPPLATPFRPLSEPDLRDELVAMAASDQAARQAWIGDGMKHGSPAEKHMLELDAQHLSRLRAIFLQQGFPDAAQIGRDGVEDFWLLAQHAASDAPFMAEVLKQAEPLMLKGDLPHRDFALMVDRVRLQQGKPQVYGSQTSVKDGHFVLKPLEDPAHVDQRRASMGLMPEAEYLKMGERMLHPDHAPPVTRKS